MLTKRKSFISHIAAAAAGSAILLAIGAGRPAERVQPEMDPAAMQAGIEKWMNSMKPGQPHKTFETFVGEWDTKTSMFMGGPGAPPLVTNGSAKFELILGGRFLKQTTNGKFEIPMGEKPMSFDVEGLGLTGYDNGRNLFTMVWADTMGTSFYTGTGNLSQDGKVMTMFGTMDEPMTGEIGKTVRYTTRVQSKDSFVFEIDEVLYGDPFTVVKIEYTRKK